MRPIHRWLLASVFAAAFLLPGLAIIPRLGIEVDEALITNGIFEGGSPLYSWNFGGVEIPVMILSYLGATKTWLFNGIFAIWPPSEMPVRLPTLLMGLATLSLFWRLLRDVAGERAAWIGAALLATDTAFLLTETIDFGFVALQHLFKLGGILLLLRFCRDGRRIWLALGFFLFGVGLWDKALFVWVFVGLAAAALTIYPREVLKRLSWQNVLVATLGLGLGALPLLTYNIAKPAETLRANANVQTVDALGKSVLIHATMSGTVGFGFFVAEEPGPKPGQPHSMIERAAFRVSRWCGSLRVNVTEVAFLLSLLAVPFLRSIRRPALFAFVFMAVTWLQMAVTAGAGAAAHHVILLWPAHLFVIALVLAQSRFGPYVAALVCVVGLLVTNQTFVDLVRNGPGLRWTDAIRPLTEALQKQKAANLVALDWGIVETVELLTEGSCRLTFAGADDLASDNKQLVHIVTNENNIFVTHTAGNEIRAGGATRLGEIAAGYNRERVLLQTIYDRNGRAVFEIFRFRPKASR